METISNIVKDIINSLDNNSNNDKDMQSTDTLPRNSDHKTIDIDLSDDSIDPQIENDLIIDENARSFSSHFDTLDNDMITDRPQEEVITTPEMTVKGLKTNNIQTEDKPTEEEEIPIETTTEVTVDYSHDKNEGKAIEISNEDISDTQSTEPIVNTSAKSEDSCVTEVSAIVSKNESNKKSRNTISERKKLTNNLDNTSKTTTFICDYEGCNKEFSTHLSRKIHIKRIHTLDKSMTDIEGDNSMTANENNNQSVVETLNSSQMNIYVNKSVKPLIKSHSRNTRSKPNIIKYLDNTSEAENIVCDYEGCHKEFTTPMSRKLHIKRIHTLDKSLQCNECHNDMITDRPQEKVFTTSAMTAKDLQTNNIQTEDIPTEEKEIPNETTTEVNIDYSHNKNEDISYPQSPELIVNTSAKSEDSCVTKQSVIISKTESNKKSLKAKKKSKNKKMVFLSNATSGEKNEQFLVNFNEIFGDMNVVTTHMNNLSNGNNNDNNDGIPVPKHVIFPLERVQLEWNQSRPIGPGLINSGNTCYINSILQCMTYCPPLVNYLLHTNYHDSIKCSNEKKFCMVCKMTQHIRQCRTHCQKAIKPTNICRSIKSIGKDFIPGRQEDAHEFLRCVIEKMKKSCLNDTESQILDPLSEETTAIDQIFGGYHRGQVTCPQCEGHSNTYEYFMDFTLDIISVTSLVEALDQFVTPEVLLMENAYNCPRCETKVLAKKQFTIFKTPNVATFQFKRFDYRRKFGVKITKKISYPETLDLRPYMSENGPPILYKLNAVLVHLGLACYSGHYQCYVRNSSNTWYLMDDSRVIQTSLDTALNQRMAYVLFYVRIDTDSHRYTQIDNLKTPSTPSLYNTSKTTTFICDYEGCNKEFSTHKSRKIHIKRIHTLDKSLKCNECNKCFATNSDLKKHQKKVHFKQLPKLLETNTERNDSSTEIEGDYLMTTNVDNNQSVIERVKDLQTDNIQTEDKPTEEEEIPIETTSEVNIDYSHNKNEEKDFEISNEDISDTQSTEPIVNTSAESEDSCVTEVSAIVSNESNKKSRNTRSKRKKLTNDLNNTPKTTTFICDYEGCHKEFSTHMSRKIQIKRIHTLDKSSTDIKTQNSPQININYNKSVERLIKSHSRNTIKYLDNTLKTKKIVCDYEGCHQTFPRKLDLVVHHRSRHTFEKPFECQDCNLKFVSNSNLKKHRKTHKYFSCKLCVKMCFNQIEIIDHYQSKHKDQYYSCNKCYFVTKNSQGLQRHFDNKHAFH